MSRASATASRARGTAGARCGSRSASMTTRSTARASARRRLGRSSCVDLRASAGVLSESMPSASSRSSSQRVTKTCHLSACRRPNSTNRRPSGTLATESIDATGNLLVDDDFADQTSRHTYLETSAGERRFGPLGALLAKSLRTSRDSVSGEPEPDVSAKPVARYCAGDVAGERGDHAAASRAFNHGDLTLVRGSLRDDFKLVTSPEVAGCGYLPGRGRHQLR